MTSRDPLFNRLRLGPLEFENRIVMAPMTRARAGAGAVPTELAAKYYAQRASAGLIVTEGTAPMAIGQGYLRVPGLYTEAQAEGWRRVTDAVHAAGGRIFVQLMFVGRVSHPSFLGGADPVAPSAVRAMGSVFTEDGPKPFVTPRALEDHEIVAIIEGYRRSARLARAAGFDGVELHGANGYLPHQFLAAATNLRTDGWGGSLARRARFLLEVTDALVEAVGAERVGVRVSPGATLNDIHDPETVAAHEYLARSLQWRRIGYVHVVRGAPGIDAVGIVRSHFLGRVIANGGYDRESAGRELATGRADLVSFGQAFIANPDLVTRLRNGLPLAEPDRETLYTDGPRGYVDYPVHAGGAATRPPESIAGLEASAL